MNNKGQSLVLFILLIPIFIMSFAYIFDSSLIVKEHIKLKNICSSAVRYTFDNKNEDYIKRYINKNDKNIKILELTINDNKTIIHTQSIIDSVFGKIVGFDTYEINAKYIGYIENGNIIIKEKG